MGADLRAAGLIVTIPAGDLDRAHSLYEGALGFEHLAISEASVLLRVGSGRARLTPGEATP
jgi:hypothetical protein